MTTLDEVAQDRRGIKYLHRDQWPRQMGQISLGPDNGYLTEALD